MDGTEKIPMGVSRCLLGENVRYDGGHKLDRFVRDTLGQFFDYVGVCPEVECGLPVPREAMRLEGDPEHPRLRTIKTREDHTDRMQAWGQGRLEELTPLCLCGYIFKSKSPSSGMERVKVYSEKGIPSMKGVGIWARMFMDRFPLVPAEEEGRLNDPALRENFITRVFVLKRFRDLLSSDLGPAGLVRFHTRHKLLIMAHHEPTYREMGRLVARAGSLSVADLEQAYLPLLLKALSFKTTRRKHQNVLMHILGYFKKILTADEKQEMLEIVSLYARGLQPLIVPVTLVNHYVRKYGQEYLSEQYYLRPHPVELGLMNHV
ncbi:MAG: DUF1722 domain-containing protein [Deltaproteobacteria bacterium]|nr:DUF1722 domain-containing protein [Deltaproteobacteria bacterium]